jgi:hypothetical protein
VNSRLLTTEDTIPQNEQRWGEAEAKAGKDNAAREHLALAVQYAQHGMALAPKNRRYAKILASIRQTLEALDQSVFWSGVGEDDSLHCCA